MTGVQPAATRDLRTDDLRAELAGIAFDRSPDIVATLSVDASWRAHALSAAGRPMLADAIVSPRSASEVARVLAVAAAAGVPVAPRAGGSGMRGGAIPNRGGLLVDLSLMDEILGMDETSGLVHVQPGVTGLRLEGWLNDRGFMFPHYPTGAHMAQVGGYLGTNGSGVMATKYGSIARLVASVEVALPSGDLVRVGGLPGYAAGPDVTGLFVGSEGTLGIVTEATLQAVPLPACRMFRALRFRDVATAIDGVRAVLQAGWRPAVARLYDDESTEQNLADGLDLDVAGVQLLLVFDGPEALALLEERRTVAALVDAGGVDEGSAPARAWWSSRYRMRAPSLPAMWGVVDVAASYGRLLSVYEALRVLLRDDYAEYDVHFDGCIPHWYLWGATLSGAFVVDRPPDRIDDALALHDEIRRRSEAAAVAHGAVVGGGRGVGLEVPPESISDVLRAIKSALDPNAVANPGKLGL